MRNGNGSSRGKVSETPRSESFCTRTIAFSEPLVVLNALQDERFRRLQLVVEHPHIRFYVGVPLITPRRISIGALCVYDDEPRTHVPPQQMDALKLLADMVVDAIEFRRLATHDSLTQVLTRGAFMHGANTEFHRARRHNYRIAAVVMDVDKFKSINDTYGHAAGDFVLRAVADLVKDEVRACDFVGRVGGEEFVILLPEIVDQRQANAIAERLRKRLAAQTVDLGEVQLAVTASFGVAISHAEDESFQRVLSRADAALYRSKIAGRDRVTCAEDGVITSAA